MAVKTERQEEQKKKEVDEKRHWVPEKTCRECVWKNTCPSSVA